SNSLFEEVRPIVNGMDCKLG
uniref:Venom prothrombin activator notanarin-D (Fragments) n=1 Tax=Notechis scutatus niger TaxID=1027870 RepID=FAXD_NOTSN|nr:RecName: Full=Venom prothrombin activator notanarin-D; Short=vPA; AltName: Full=Venom coagulation factor Xa-like protease; Contains: RecName: Full=Notanarin-D light chain; Contains: RecName: Full=Notanarin-D heavy chain; Flags: Precursor [Notechis scutatus niger]